MEVVVSDACSMEFGSVLPLTSGIWFCPVGYWSWNVYVKQAWGGLDEASEQEEANEVYCVLSCTWYCQAKWNLRLITHCCGGQNRIPVSDRDRNGGHRGWQPHHLLQVFSRYSREETVRHTSSSTPKSACIAWPTHLMEHIYHYTSGTTIVYGEGNLKKNEFWGGVGGSSTQQQQQQQRSASNYSSSSSFTAFDEKIQKIVLIHDGS